MIAVKENMEYTVTETNMEEYRKQGFDIYENGTIIAYGAGKTISMDTYRLLEKRYENLMAENARLISELEAVKKPKKSSKKEEQ